MNLKAMFVLISLFMILGGSVYTWNASSDLEDIILFKGDIYRLASEWTTEMENLSFTGFEVDGDKVFFDASDNTSDSIYLQHGDTFLKYMKEYQTTHAEFNIGGCIREGDVPPHSSVYLDGKDVVVEMRIDYYCCAELEMEAIQEGNVIHICTINYGDVCRCICRYRLECRLSGLENGDYTIKVCNAVLDEQWKGNNKYDVMFEEIVEIH